MFHFSSPRPVRFVINMDQDMAMSAYDAWEFVRFEKTLSVVFDELPITFREGPRKGLVKLEPPVFFDLANYDVRIGLIRGMISGVRCKLFLQLSM